MGLFGGQIASPRAMVLLYVVVVSMVLWYWRLKDIKEITRPSVFTISTVSTVFISANLVDPRTLIQSHIVSGTHSLIVLEYPRRPSACSKHE